MNITCPSPLSLFANRSANTAFIEKPIEKRAAKPAPSRTCQSGGNGWLVYQRRIAKSTPFPHGFQVPGVQPCTRLLTGTQRLIVVPKSDAVGDQQRKNGFPDDIPGGIDRPCRRTYHGPGQTSGRALRRLRVEKLLTWRVPGSQGYLFGGEKINEKTLALRDSCYRHCTYPRLGIEESLVGRCHDDKAVSSSRTA